MGEGGVEGAADGKGVGKAGGTGTSAAVAAVIAAVVVAEWSENRKLPPARAHMHMYARLERRVVRVRGGGARRKKAPNYT